MSESTHPTAHDNHAGWDSLTTDIILADDQGGYTILPADPAALALFLNERRQLELRPTPKTQESEP